MNRYLKTSIAAIFAVSTFAGVANAGSKDSGPSPEERKVIDQNTTGSVQSDSFMTNDTVGMWTTGKLSVVPVSTLNDVDPHKTMLMDRMKTNPDDVAALQTAIQNNPALKTQLESQNVQLQNIVAAEKATDGSVTFYVQ